MFSVRFHRTVVLTRHAVERMAQRHVSDEELLAVIDTGDTKYKDGTH